jgi:EAL domain-containing protein (putative c-di-GMP-specific phosphodiesterase class I)
MPNIYFCEGSFRELEKLGVASAVDDFGTGYSSLAYLKQFPAEYLEIDQTFVDGLPEDADDQSLSETISPAPSFLVFCHSSRA